MSAFAVNLVTQFFGVTAVAAATGSGDTAKTAKQNFAEATKVGTAMVGTTKNGDVYLKYLGLGGIMRSDLINPALVKWAKYVDADALNTKTLAYTITPDATVVADNLGKDLILRIDIKNFCGDLSANNHYFKHAAVHVKKYMFTGSENAETFTTTNTSTSPAFVYLMASLIAKSFARDYDNMVKVFIDSTEITKNTKPEAVTVTASSVITIKALRPEVDPIMFVGLNDELDFEVYCGSYNDAIDEDVWGTVTKVDGYKMTNTDKLIALEDFALKERGDIYGYTGYPYVHPSKTVLAGLDFVADGAGRGADDARTGLDVLTIHFAYQGANELVHLSEKDLTIAGPTAVITALKKSFATAGIVFDTVAVSGSTETVTEANVAGKILADADESSIPDSAE